MLDLENKQVLVLGLDNGGQAACELLRRHGANVAGIDIADTEDLRERARKLRSLGVEVALGVSVPPRRTFNLAVLTQPASSDTGFMRAVLAIGVPVIGELELGFQQTQCLSVAIGGTNGKSTTAAILDRVLRGNHRKALVAGHRARPVCSIVDETKALDFLILQVDSFQLERTNFFRPAVAVLLNLAPDHLDAYSTADDYVRAHARLFHNQQVFDWAIIQSEALAQLRKLGLPVRAKTITFSANDSSADLYLDRGLIISRLPNWSGPLLDIDHCQLPGPHNAENLMAALATGHVLRLPLENMVDPMKTCTAGPHRFELVAEINGVQFINDSKATNLHALHKGLLAARPGRGGEANVWLIAGGWDKGLEFHDIGPVLSKRVRHAFVIGNAAERIRTAWSLFTPCTTAGSLLEAVQEAATQAAPGDVVLLSPACSSFDQFRDYQQCGEIFCKAVKSIGRGARTVHPHMNGNHTAN